MLEHTWHGLDHALDLHLRGDGLRARTRRLAADVDEIGAEPAQVVEQVGGVAANVEAHRRAHGVDAVDQALFGRPDELVVQVAADEGGRGVADPDVVGPGLHLGGGEGKSSGGRHPCSPWGMPTKGYKTRKKKPSDRLIVKRRK